MYVVPEDKYKSMIEKTPTDHFLLQSAPNKLRLAHSKLNEAPVDSIHRCHICDRNFKHVNQLAHHLKSHVLDGFKCNICDKVFKHRRTLNHHLAAHPPQVTATAAQSAAQAPHSAATHCGVCSKTFKHKRNLLRHERSHRGGLLNFDTTTKWQTI